MGVSTALDTLGSQAHGEGNSNGVISCCVSAMSVLTVLCVPVAVALLVADPVSQAIFQQTPEGGAVSLIAGPELGLSTTIKTEVEGSFWCLQLVGVFCKALLPGLLPLVWSIAILKVGCRLVHMRCATMHKPCEVLKLPASGCLCMSNAPIESSSC